MAAVMEAPAPAPAHEEPGLLGWVTTVDHKRIGILYLLASLLFFVVGGTFALVMRLQLAWPRLHLVSPGAYNALMTMHGTTMIFLVVMPCLIGLGTYLVPLMIGARDMALPRLNAFGFWVFLFGAVLLYFGSPPAGLPRRGWFNAPLSEANYSGGAGMDYWALGLLAVGIGLPQLRGLRPPHVRGGAGPPLRLCVRERQHADRGEPAGDNPWRAWTLEWACASPPPPWNFDRVPPVRSRRPVWDLDHPEDPDWRRAREGTPA